MLQQQHQQQQAQLSAQRALFAQHAREQRLLVAAIAELVGGAAAKKHEECEHQEDLDLAAELAADAAREGLYTPCAPSGGSQPSPRPRLRRSTSRRT